MTDLLLIIDIQRDYFPGGACPLVEPDDAAARAAEVLAAFRARGLPVVHVQHVWDAPDAAFMAPGTAGVEIHPAVAPVDGEAVIQKHFPNSFRETALAELLGTSGADRLVVCGMQSNLCVDATVRAAVDLGHDAVLVHDACAAADLEFGGEALPGATVHATFMAALADYAAVVTADEAIAGLAAA